jgi:hypothetical protein
MNISDPTETPAPTSTHGKKEEPHPMENRKPNRKTELMMGLNNGVSHMHVQQHVWHLPP